MTMHLENRHADTDSTIAPAPIIQSVERTRAPSEGRVGITVLTMGGEERAGRLMTISDDLMNAEIVTLPVPKAGEPVVFYLDSGMRFVATCKRVLNGVATLRLKLSPRRQEAGSSLPGLRVERAERVQRSDDEACTLRMIHGTRHDCRVLDISLTGIFVATEADLAVGDQVRVGRAAAEVVRKTPQGYGMRLVNVGQRPVPNPAAKRRADQFAGGNAPLAAVA